MTVYLLGDEIRFPDPRQADESGLLAVGGDLSVERLVAAYRCGIFPWYSDDQPVLWWSPDPRLVFWPGQLKLDRDTRRLIRGNHFEIRLDSAFDQVIEACRRAPRPGQDGTWITFEMREAYIALHRAGWAHSVEAWRDGRLCGGLYGVAMGQCFFGESMFARETNASKVALACLADIYSEGLIDGQMDNPHLRSLGGALMTREAFLLSLAQYVGGTDAWKISRDFRLA